MCGIAGFVGQSDDVLLRRMAACITHRGPDEDGFYTADGVGLCMRRLSVIDLHTGRQPISNEDRSVWVVFNGEIYNYQELTERLKAAGHVFSTRSDTETIVHLYEEFGLDFPRHLRGMFGIALWDARRRRLVLVRDRIGEKPLFYSESGDRVAFGSEIKSILQDGRSREVEPRALCEFLAASYVPAPRTFFRGIRKLPPGFMLVHESGRTATQPYWRFSDRSPSKLTFDDAAAQLTDLLRETIRLCLKSDVEVGAFLSGGLDSSLIVALMAEQGADIQTFSVGYRGAAAGFNELVHASVVSKHVGTRHHELIIDAGPSMHLLPSVLWSFDEPLGEPTSVLVNILCEFARRRVKVALGGTGSDEAFFGYPRHAGISLLQRYRRIPAFLRRSLIEPLVARWPESTRGSRLAKRVRRLVAGSELEPGAAYLLWVSLLRRDVREGLLSDRVARESDDPAGDAFMREILLRHDDRPLLNRAAELDLCRYLPDFQLTYMDRMSMAHGLEVRSPFCDYRLIEFVASLPAQFRLRGARSKHILKTIATRWLPRSIVERRKVGFDSPIGEWFKGELRSFIERFLSVEHVRQSGLLNPQAVQNLIAQHMSGRRDYSLQLWSVLMVEAWYRMYVEDAVDDISNYRLQNMRGAADRVAFRSVAGQDAPVPT